MYFETDREYHKYDTIAYPKGTSISKSFMENMRQKGLFSAAASSFFQLFKGHDSEAESQTKLQPMSVYDDSKFCLQVYLTPYTEIVCSGKLQGKSLYQLIKDVHHIYWSLSSYYTIPFRGNTFHHFSLPQQKFKEVYFNAYG